MHVMRLMLVILSALLATSAQAIAGVKEVWATHDADKTEQDNLSSTSKSGNRVWDGKVIHLFGARNEILAFQVVVEADPAGIKSLSAALPELTNRESRIVYSPPDSDPTNYVGREIQIFSVHYLNVTQPTQAWWIYHPGSPTAPADPKGLKPVQLVPENARRGKGGFPLSVAPSRLQALWFDIYLRHDLAPGTYQGTVSVTADDQVLKLPVELEVFDFSLPDENSMHAMVFYERHQLGLYHGRDLDAQYQRFAHRQRIELVQGWNEASLKREFGQFSGEDFTQANGYAGPGERIGNRIAPATFYGPGRDFDERAAAWKRADDWMTFLRGLLPRAITFVYMPDEPDRSQFPRIRKIAENIHSNPGPGKALPVFVTHEYTPDLDGSIDIWCSGPQGYFIDKAKEERAKGHEYWIYNGGRPFGGAIVIDAPATDARATIWGSFKHDIPVYFYWHGLHWQHNTQKVGNRMQNVWADPVTFDNRGQPNKPASDQSFANGDGVLMYPGEEKQHTDEDRGIAGPCSTLQLANFRRGLQDHLYLTMARQAGLDQLVNEGLQTVVPRMFSDADEKQLGFSENADDYENVRYRLGKAIEAKQKGRSKTTE